MEELIGRIVSNVGIDEGLAQKAVGMILGFLQQEGPEDKVSSLMGALPGAEDLISAASGDGGGGGGWLRLCGVCDCAADFSLPPGRQPGSHPNFMIATRPSHRSSLSFVAPFGPQQPTPGLRRGLWPCSHPLEFWGPRLPASFSSRGMHPGLLRISLHAMMSTK